MGDQCASCGRVSVDWVDPDSTIRTDGLKGSQRPALEDRESRYREWRRTFGSGAFVNDIDQVEWRRRGSRLYPVAFGPTASSTRA